MKIEFTVPYPARKSAWTKRYGLNAYWAGKNHHVRAADARDLEALVRLCLRQQSVPVRLLKSLCPSPSGTIPAWTSTTMRRSRKWSWMRSKAGCSGTMTGGITERNIAFSTTKIT